MYYKVVEQAALHEALEMIADLWDREYCLGNPQDLILAEVSWHPEFRLQEVA
jgi:hypothetical protein